MPAHLPSLHRQLMNWLLTPLLVIWIFGGIMSYAMAVRFAGLAYDRALFDSALTLSSQIESLNSAIIVNQSDTALKMIEIDPYDRIYFKISDREHGVIAGNRELPAPPGSNFLPDKPYYQDGSIDGKHVRIASLYHRVANGKRGDLVLVQVAETLLKRRLLASEILASIVLPQLLLISLAAIIVWYGVRRGLSSLQRIQDEVRSRSHLDLSPVREDNAPREIGTLVHAINELLRQLKQVLASQTTFIADAAHQLRTPLAGLKTQTELALRQTEPASIQHSLQQLQHSSDRIIHLVNQLLVLARAEAGSEPEKTSIDLVAIASTTTGEWVPAALRKSIDLGFGHSIVQAPMLGNALLLKEMLNNLIDNAVRYTQPGGEITVDVRAVNEHWLLSVQDNGPGVPAAERELVFERFHRAATAEGDGCGLGLAIVRNIAHIHNGEVQLVDTVSGALFEVRLPAPPTIKN